MQVTHTQDHVTHAVISGAQAIDFGISDSAEFFQILSSTLYSDQMLAVVRETLCNEWDAHIEAGCTDIPVQITLDDKYFIIRDFGPGIPKHMIGPIYGTYGGSTKVANGNVTGGFGLGCKAPFAYVDNFEVTSWCDGERTIYRLSKSNAEVGGKPSIIPVISSPTTEHGLQVKIAVKSEGDRRRFAQLIQRIVQNGAMNVTLNGNKLPTLPFDDMVNGFMLTKNTVLENFSPIVIRYGNVIYPIDNDPVYQNEWSQIVAFLTRLVGGKGYGVSNNEWTLVLQAAPNTVSVTPSRESLSLQKHTLTTIKTLMEQFLASKEKELAQGCFKLLGERIESTYLDASPMVLFDITERMPNTFRPKRGSDGSIYKGYNEEFIYELENNLTEFPSFVKRYARSAYPDFKNFRKRDIILRINALIQSGFNGASGKKMLRSYRRAYEQSFVAPTRSRSRRNGYRDIQSPWFHQHVVWPLIKGMTKDSGLSKEKLYVYGGYGGHYRHDRDKIKPVKSYSSLAIDKMLPFLRNIVILSFNKMDVTDGDANHHAISKYWLGDTMDSLVYVVPRAEEKIKKAREYFLARGVNLIDLTVEQTKEYVQKQQVAVVENIPKKPKKTGIPRLSALVTPNGMYNNKAADATDGADRIQNPEFIIKDGRRNESNEFEGLNIPTTKYLIELYGKVGGLCVNQNQYDRYKTNGAVDWEEYVLDKLVEEYQTNPRIREFLPYDTSRVDADSYASDFRGLSPWMNIIINEQDLLEYFGLVDNRTDKDKKMMKLYKAMKKAYRFGKNQQKEKIEQEIKLLALRPEPVLLYQKLRTAKLLSIMGYDGCSVAILHPEANLLTDNQSNKARDLLVAAIEG